MSEDIPHYGPMTEQRAREILGGTNLFSEIQLRRGHEYTQWVQGDSNACLDGRFTAEELEAIAWWMRNCPSSG